MLPFYPDHLTSFRHRWSMIQRARYVQNRAWRVTGSPINQRRADLPLSKQSASLCDLLMYCGVSASGFHVLEIQCVPPLSQLHSVPVWCNATVSDKWFGHLGPIGLRIVKAFTWRNIIIDRILQRDAGMPRQVRYRWWLLDFAHCVSWDYSFITIDNDTHWVTLLLRCDPLLPMRFVRANEDLCTAKESKIPKEVRRSPLSFFTAFCMAYWLSSMFFPSSFL